MLSNSHWMLSLLHCPGQEAHSVLLQNKQRAILYGLVPIPLLKGWRQPGICFVILRLRTVESMALSLYANTTFSFSLCVYPLSWFSFRVLGGDMLKAESRSVFELFVLQPRPAWNWGQVVLGCEWQWNIWYIYGGLVCTRKLYLFTSLVEEV